MFDFATTIDGRSWQQGHFYCNREMTSTPWEGFSTAIGDRGWSVDCSLEKAPLADHCGVIARDGPVMQCSRMLAVFFDPHVGSVCIRSGGNFARTARQNGDEAALAELVALATDTVSKPLDEWSLEDLEQWLGRIDLPTSCDAQLVLEAITAGLSANFPVGVFLEELGAKTLMWKLVEGKVCDPARVARDLLRQRDMIDDKPKSVRVFAPSKAELAHYENVLMGACPASHYFIQQWQQARAAKTAAEESEIVRLATEQGLTVPTASAM